MALNGTLRPHGLTIGYVVYMDGVGIGSDCHGYDDPNLHVLLGGNLATLFDKKSHAQRAVRDSLIADPNRRFRIIRVARRR